MKFYYCFLRLLNYHPYRQPATKMSGEASGGPSAADKMAWLMNVVSCVAIIMVNKELMGKSGYNFNYTTTLCGLHFMITSFGSKALKYYYAPAPNPTSPITEEEVAAAEEKERNRLPLTDLVIFVIVANVSIVSLNTSLMINPVSLYQIAKLGIPPLSATVERIWFGTTYSPQQMGAMVLTLAGVGLVTVAEFAVEGDPVGIFVAGISIFSSAMQQILCGHYQRKNNIKANDFLGAVSTWQAITCLVFGPFIDYAFTGSWVTNYSLTVGSSSFIALSCFTAVFVNASHFMYVRLPF